MSGAYRLADEPNPGALEGFTVKPFWPLLSVMFAGAWMAWSWFVFNAFASGSPTRKRELRLVVVGFFGSAVLSGLLLWTVNAELVTLAMVPYVSLPLLVWKLGISYATYNLQARTFAIFEYYGGSVRSGFPILLVGAIGGQAALIWLLAGNPFLLLTLR